MAHERESETSTPGDWDSLEFERQHKGSDMKRFAIAVLATASLSGCAISSATLQADATSAKADLSQALNAWGVAKGIADVAVLADPALALPVGAMEAVIDPLVPIAQSMLTATAPDMQQLTQLMQQIQTEIAAIETATAPQIKVVSNK